jgi:hypothetical protein
MIAVYGYKLFSDETTPVSKSSAVETGINNNSESRNPLSFTPSQVAAGGAADNAEPAEPAEPIEGAIKTTETANKSTNKNPEVKTPKMQEKAPDQVTSKNIVTPPEKKVESPQKPKPAQVIVIKPEAPVLNAKAPNPATKKVQEPTPAQMTGKNIVKPQEIKADGPQKEKPAPALVNKSEAPKINPVTPNQAASEYTLKEGETITGVLDKVYRVPRHLIYNESIVLLQKSNPSIKDITRAPKGAKIIIPPEVIEFGKSNKDKKTS